MKCISLWLCVGVHGARGQLEESGLLYHYEGSETQTEVVTVSHKGSYQLKSSHQHHMHVGARPPKSKGVGSPENKSFRQL